MANCGDYADDSGLAFDFVGLQPGFSNPVPEPGTGGLLGLGALKRRRARR